MWVRRTTQNDIEISDRLVTYLSEEQDDESQIKQNLFTHSLYLSFNALGVQSVLLTDDLFSKNVDETIAT